MAHPDDPFIGLPEASMLELARRISVAEQTGSAFHGEIRIDKKEGTAKVRVVMDSVEGRAALFVTNPEPDVNESVLCPGPFCPWT